MSTYISLRMQFDEIFLPLKTNLSYFGPGNCVDFGEILEDKNPHVGHSEIQWNTFMVLKREKKQKALFSLY